MEEKKPVRLGPWAMVALAVAILIVALNSDPVGDTLVRVFGQDADRLAINITIVIVLMVYLFISKKK